MQMQNLKNLDETELVRQVEVIKEQIEEKRSERDALMNDLRVFFGSDETAIQSLWKRRHGFDWGSNARDLGATINSIAERQDEIDQLNAERGTRDSGPRV